MAKFKVGYWSYQFVQLQGQTWSFTVAIAFICFLCCQQTWKQNMFAAKKLFTLQNTNCHIGMSSAVYC